MTDLHPDHTLAALDWQPTCNAREHTGTKPAKSIARWEPMDRGAA